MLLDFYRRIWVIRQPKWQAPWEAKPLLVLLKNESGEPRDSKRDGAGWVLSGEGD